MDKKVHTARQRGFSLVELLILIIVVSLLGVVGYFVYTRHHQTTYTANPLTSSQGSFRVTGNKIIAPSGNQFVPYGVVIECAAIKNTNISAICSGKDTTQNTGSEVVSAAAKSWNANIVRFQVAQETLFSGPNGAVNQQYVDLVDSLVKQANSLGMVAIVTLQEEDYSGPAYPIDTSTAFWQFMAIHYKNSPDVFFDLYNEPRLPVAAFGSSGTEDDLWRVWQNGGTAQATAGDGSQLSSGQANYVGMQSLVNTIRSTGANNIIVAESPGGDKDLSELTTHYLQGSNIAYGIEPNLKNDTTTAEQNTKFGQYTKSVPIMPEAFLDNYGTQSCDPNSPVDLPNLLSYLKSIHMGLIFWSLNPGVGIVGNNLNDPTSYPSGVTSIKSDFCPQKGKKKLSATNTIGDGALIQAFYKANSVQL